MVTEIKNMFLINAPAGSGKTTKIKKMISNILDKEENTNILAITFTNRAVNELSDEIENSRVKISTIHSFVNDFINVFFKNDKIIELFFEEYKSKIKELIRNDNEKDNIKKINTKYKEKFGELNFKIVKKNINKISYNELPYNTLYYGGLSHDDLLTFTKKIIDKFDVVKRKLKAKYKHVFIDEYQDTDSVVLKFFYDVYVDTNTQVYLFGDAMQRIYDNYKGDFEDKLEEFDQTRKLDINYRSTKSILEVLNNLYGNPEYQQKSCDNSEEESQPKVLICNNIKQVIKEKTEDYSNFIKLYPYNSQRFKSIGVSNLYRATKNIEKYGYNKKYSIQDILLDDTDENPDLLFSLLFFIMNIYKKFKNKKYGPIIQNLKEKKIYNNKFFSIEYYFDKVKLYEKLSDIFRLFNSQKNNNIKDLLEKLKKYEVVRNEVLEEILNNEEYKEVLQTEISELQKLDKSINNPSVSTQHGVKGEGYENVFFIAKDAGCVGFKIYEFLELFSKITVDFKSFQKFYYSILNDFKGLKKRINIKITSLNKVKYEENKEYIDCWVNSIYDDYINNKYFKEIYSDIFKKYKEKSNVTNFRKININKIKRIIRAYKIFYVGCSRAKKNLLVFIEKEKVKSYKKRLIKKFNNIGFEVKDFS